METGQVNPEWIKAVELELTHREANYGPWRNKRALAWAVVVLGVVVVPVFVAELLKGAKAIPLAFGVLVGGSSLYLAVQMLRASRTLQSAEDLQELALRSRQCEACGSVMLPYDGSRCPHCGHEEESMQMFRANVIFFTMLILLALVVLSWILVPR